MCKKAVILCIVLTDDERNDEEVETPNYSTNTDSLVGLRILINDVWVYDIPVEHLGKSTNLIFNNAGAGAQTVDLGPFVLDKDYVFDNSNAAIK